MLSISFPFSEKVTVLDVQGYQPTVTTSLFHIPHFLASRSGSHSATHFIYTPFNVSLTTEIVMYCTAEWHLASESDGNLAGIPHSALWKSKKTSRYEIRYLKHVIGDRRAVRGCLSLHFRSSDSPNGILLACPVVWQTGQQSVPRWTLPRLLHSLN